MGSNIYVEIRALLEGVLYCHTLGIQEFQIRRELLLVINGPNKEDNITCSLRKRWRYLEVGINNSKFIYKHVYMELN